MKSEWELVDKIQRCGHASFRELAELQFCSQLGHNVSNIGDAYNKSRNLKEDDRLFGIVCSILEELYRLGSKQNSLDAAIEDHQRWLCNFQPDVKELAEKTERLRPRLVKRWGEGILKYIPTPRLNRWYSYKKYMMDKHTLRVLSSAKEWKDLLKVKGIGKKTLENLKRKKEEVE